MKTKIFKKVLVVLLISAVLISGCAAPSENSTQIADIGVNEMNENNETKNEEEEIKEVVFVEKGDTIKVEYRGTLEDGTEFDSSEGRAPLEFTAGVGLMIEGFDAAVLGMKLLEDKTITISPEEAYGAHNPALIVEFPKENLVSSGITPEVGMMVSSDQGPAKIVEVGEDAVKLDFNHPLAGKTLIFWIKVIEITKKSALGE